MSEQEKYEAQGRAHATLKMHRSNIATLTVSLREYSKTLMELSHAIDAFVRDPGRREPPGAIKPQSENLRDHLRRLNVATDRADSQLDELFMEAGKARLLQEEIEKF
jgi:hypothetical protein